MNNIRGFRDFGVDILVKLGGSLLVKNDDISQLGALLAEAGRKHRIVVFPGGGPIDNYIEEVDAEWHFPGDIHHQLCARAQDQTGLMFSAKCPGSGVFTRPVELGAILDSKRVAIMLPMEQIISLDVFARVWEITSDSMAAWFANFFSARRFAILTNVPGIRWPFEEGNYLSQIDTQTLSELGRTSVDECLAAFMAKHSMSCSVLDGRDVDNLAKWIDDKPHQGTTILPVIPA
ncbi:MAG: hypothetical protein M3460_20585 [Actinomycetota bacterium]|nr:hypothetical protein [Actinomycetota bacterium]